MFWDGTRWISPRANRTAPTPPRRQARDWLATGIMILAAVAVAFPFIAARADVPIVTMTPGSGNVGTRVVLEVQGVPAGTALQVTWDGTAAGMPAGVISRKGQLRLRFAVPQTSSGEHSVAVVTTVPTGGGGPNRRTATLQPPGIVLATAAFAVAGALPEPTPPPPSLVPDPTATTIPTPAATAQPTPIPTPVPTPIATPVVTPVPTPAPAPVPPGCSRIASADATGATDATATLMADINATPAGGTLCLVAAGTYRLNGQLHIANRNGLTIEGNAATIRRPAESSTPLVLIDEGGNDITLRNFTLDGASSQPGVWRASIEAGHAIRIGGAIRVSLVALTLRNVTGDGLYIAGGGSSFRPADTVTLRNSVIDGTGRNGVSITDGGNNVVIAANVFRRIGYYTFDIEPNGHTELGSPGAIGVDFVDNALGPQAYAYNPSVHGFVMAITGSSGGGPAIDIDYSRNTLVGQPFRVGVYDNGGARQNIRVTYNRSDTWNTGLVMTPLLSFAGVSGLTVTNNVGFSNSEVITSGSSGITLSANQ
jgi:hypothetical protein